MSNRKLKNKLKKIIRRQPSLVCETMKSPAEGAYIVVNVLRTETHYESYLIDWADDADDAKMYFEAMTESEKRMVRLDWGRSIDQETIDVEILDALPADISEDSEGRLHNGASMLVLPSAAATTEAVIRRTYDAA